MNFINNISEALVVITILMFATLGFILSIKTLVPITREYYQYQVNLTSRATKEKKRIFLLEQRKKIQALYLAFIGSILTIIICIYSILQTII